MDHRTYEMCFLEKDHHVEDLAGPAGENVQTCDVCTCNINILSTCLNILIVYIVLEVCYEMHTTEYLKKLGNMQGRTHF